MANGLWRSVPTSEGTSNPVAPGQPRPIPGFTAADVPIGWSADGRNLYAFRHGEFPAKVYTLDIENNQKKLVKQLMPRDPAGVNIIHPILVTSDGRSYVYGYRRTLSDLYLVEGLK